MTVADVGLRVSSGYYHIRSFFFSKIAEISGKLRPAKKTLR